MRSYFNDILMIPCALPLVLWVHAQLGWRSPESVPSGREVLGHLVLWSIIAEFVGPRLMAHPFADLRDIAAYSLGASMAFLWWQYSDLGHAVAGQSNDFSRAEMPDKMRSI